MNHIFSMLGSETLTTLCSVACVSRTLRSFISGALSFSSVDFSAVSLHPQAFPSDKWKINKIIFDCFHLDDSSIKPFLGSHVVELVLLKCRKLSFSYSLFGYIGTTCPNLRVLTLEISGSFGDPTKFDSNLKCLLRSCRCIVSLCIKIRGEIDYMLRGIFNLLPETIKVLKLVPTTEWETVDFLRSLSASAAPMPLGKTLTHISIVVENITDALLVGISHALPLLIELNLKDRPSSEAEDDLTDQGIQSLIGCKYLTSLSLRRVRRPRHASFRFVTDTGIIFLAEGCKKLESVQLGGFVNITDVGFTRILTSCLNLKKFVIRNNNRLTDLAFQALSEARKPLVEVKLVSCYNISSELMCKLTTCSALEALHLRDCFDIRDSCLRNVSRLTSLRSLNLRGANVTDAGMSVLGIANTPISHLSLRYCCRITDKGVALLLANEGKIVKTLSSLDLGYIDGLTDKAISTVVNACVGLTELCIRFCEHVTDASIMALALKGELEGESKRLQRLDLYRCSSLSVGLSEFLKKSLFHGLHWIGVGATTMDANEFGRFAKVCERHTLTICNVGCEMGCNDRWKRHWDRF